MNTITEPDWKRIRHLKLQRSFKPIPAGYGASQRAYSRLDQLWKPVGVRFEHQWTGKEYLKFLEEHGWHVTFSQEMAARITLMYAECERSERI